MKKFLIALWILIFTVSINADIKYDKNYKKFYSFPITVDVNPDRYHDLFTHITNQIFQLKRTGSSDKKIEKEIISYLKALNSPLSLRLLQDITKNGFYGNILRLSAWLPCPQQFEKHIRNVFKDEFGKDNEIGLDIFINLVDDVLVMIITCWNNGAYGKTLHSQIVSYLKAIGTPQASKVLEMWDF